MTAKKKEVMIAGMEDIDTSSVQVAGMEESGAESFVPPIVSLIQDNSPYIKPQRPEYIPGATGGMFLNRSSQNLYETANVVPVFYLPIWTHWHPRDAAESGLIATYRYDDPKAQEAEWTITETGRRVRQFPDGTELTDTRQHYVLMCGEDPTQYEPGILSLSGSQLRRSSKWLAEMRSKRVIVNGKQYTPPTYATFWHMAAQNESNAKGDWYGYKFTFHHFLKGDDDKDLELYNTAKALYQDLKGGTYPLLTN